MWDIRASARTGEISRLIEDHANVITRALGFPLPVAVDLMNPPHDGTPLLLCTEGAWRPFDRNLMGHGPPDLLGAELADWLRDRHVEDGERDDACLVIVGAQRTTSSRSPSRCR